MLGSDITGTLFGIKCQLNLPQMACCNHCMDAEKIFNEKTALRDVKRYHKKGLRKSTRLMLEPIRNDDLGNMTLLDIGGGIGSISFELFEMGIRKSTHVDASTGYLKIAKKQAEERNLNRQIEFRFGDFVELSSDLESADIVTLDRVICCYPDREKMIENAALKAKKYIGLVYPRDRWGANLAITIGNIWFKMQGSDFRTFIHRPEDVDRQIRNYGFSLINKSQTLVWEAVVYQNVHGSVI